MQTEVTTPPANRIAIVVPAYNAVAHIAETLQSVLAQTHPVDEIVLVDDGSADDTAALAARLHPKIKVVRQANAGQCVARQKGLEATTAEYILFLDHDDLLSPDALKVLLAALLAQPAAALAYGRAEMWTPGTPESVIPDDLPPPPPGQDLWNVLLNGNFIRSPGCVLLRRSALVAAGGWETDMMPGNEDWELWWRLSEKHPFVSVPETVLRYRIHLANYSKNPFKMYRSLFDMFGKHQARWTHDPHRRRRVVAQEWNCCECILRDRKREFIAALRQGRLGTAWKQVSLAVRFGPVPFWHRLRMFGLSRVEISRS